jgi:hypothetical protein
MHWKAKPKNAAQYDEIFQRLRGAKIKSHLDNVEAHSAKDWRASIAYIEKTMPEKYSTKIEIAAQPPAPATSPAVLEALLAMSAKVFNQLPKSLKNAASVTASPPVALIADEPPKP